MVLGPAAGLTGVGDAQGRRRGHLPVQTRTRHDGIPLHRHARGDEALPNPRERAPMADAVSRGGYALDRPFPAAC